ncbi:aldose 1-epimerase family protein [Spirosoma montaniterrae]|uniref:DUF4432 domain-containing protein n=1 Tax=Spirosoma montaniterrae TaxID=1178516 RepID=A0A1P9X2Y1_9BACT|nr:aldose 1-epimerase family protein [Spirosoma montaniterrae]AQG81955.1 DUF4432 domain-containing protein [Spirosoma montaniterrae]
MSSQPWQPYVGNVAQLGGIETSVLDNGPGRGTRIAWVNTGAGLRYKVALDRAMDIVDAFQNEYSLAWLSHGGLTSAEPGINKGIDWLRTFPGGLMTTCGLTNVGGPNQDEYGERGLHGRISNLPAEIESIRQPDPATGDLTMRITGRMRESQVFGPNLELKRTIASTLGEPVIRIHDTVTNRGNTAAPHMLLYHLNFGWPLVEAGTRIRIDGKLQPRNDPQSLAWFREGNEYLTCPAPLDDHNGTGEVCAFIDPNADETGWCSTGLVNNRLKLAVQVRFRKEQLPWLSNWQHWGRGEYVTGLEPGTHPPIGQAQARQTGTLIFIEPGESREYELEIAVITPPPAPPLKQGEGGK